MKKAQQGPSLMDRSVMLWRGKLTAAVMETMKEAVMAARTEAAMIAATSCSPTVVQERSIPQFLELPMFNGGKNGEEGSPLNQEERIGRMTMKAGFILVR